MKVLDGMSWSLICCYAGKVERRIDGLKTSNISNSLINKVRLFITNAQQKMLKYYVKSTPIEIVMDKSTIFISSIYCDLKCIIA